MWGREKWASSTRSDHTQPLPPAHWILGACMQAQHAQANQAGIQHCAHHLGSGFSWEVLDPLLIWLRGMWEYWPPPKGTQVYAAPPLSCHQPIFPQPFQFSRSGAHLKSQVLKETQDFVKREDSQRHSREKEWRDQNGLGGWKSMVCLGTARRSVKQRHRYGTGTGR